MQNLGDALHSRAAPGFLLWNVRSTKRSPEVTQLGDISQETVTVDCVTVDGSAKAGSDFEFTSGLGCFSVGGEIISSADRGGAPCVAALCD